MRSAMLLLAGVLLLFALPAQGDEGWDDTHPVTTTTLEAQRAPQFEFSLRTGAQAAFDNTAVLNFEFVNVSIGRLLNRVDLVAVHFAFQAEGDACGARDSVGNGSGDSLVSCDGTSLNAGIEYRHSWRWQRVRPMVGGGLAFFREEGRGERFLWGEEEVGRQYETFTRVSGLWPAVLFGVGYEVSDSMAIGVEVQPGIRVANQGGFSIAVNAGPRLSLRF